MLFVLAGVLAAVAAWIGNRTALKAFGTKVIVIFGPLLEELFKTGSALILGTSVLLTHGVFGLIEAVYDARGTGFRGTWAGLISMAGHILFGYINQLVLIRYNLFFAAIFAGYSIHMFWNLIVMKLIVTRKEAVH